MLFQRLWAYIQANPGEFAGNLQTQFAGNLQTGLSASRKLVRGIRSNKKTGKPQTNTDRTPETTSPIKQQQAIPPPAPLRQNVADVVVEDIVADVNENDAERAGADQCAASHSDNPTEATHETGTFEGDGVAPHPISPPSALHLQIASVDPATQEMLLKELVTEGMGVGQAQKAVANHFEAAAMQLENLRYALPEEVLRPANRGAWLHVAITDGYGPTKGYARHLAGKEATVKRQAASERREAAQQAESEAKRAVELELTPDETASLNQKARNRVRPELRRRSEIRNAALIRANYEKLLAREKIVEFAAWSVPGATERSSA